MELAVKLVIPVSNVYVGHITVLVFDSKELRTNRTGNTIGVVGLFRYIGLLFGEGPGE